MKLLLITALLATGCTYRRVIYPSIADRDAGSWVCTTDLSEPNTHVCWDAAKVFEMAHQERMRREKKL